MYIARIVLILNKIKDVQCYTAFYIMHSKYVTVRYRCMSSCLFMLTLLNCDAPLIYVHY